MSTLRGPRAFTQQELDWEAWLEPLEEEGLDDRQRKALVSPGREKSPYFRLLARDPAILEARTRTDIDIFYNLEGGLPRAERELAAVAASRVNGCVYCASVHARLASSYGKRPEDVQRLLDHGLSADLGERWNAQVAVAAKLTATPSTLADADLAALEDQGLDPLAIADLIHAAAFFNWANRLMLSLGEPVARG